MSNLYCKVKLHQPLRPDIKQVEEARTICQLGSDLLWGSEAKGLTPFNVSLFAGCPEGGNPIGIWHSHPGGKVEPSPQDLAEMRRVGLRNLCISDDFITKCFKVK